MGKPPQPSLPIAVLQSLWGGVVFCAVEFWKWPVISIVAGLILAFGMSAMYGDQYIAAACAFFIGITLFTARAVTESHTRKESAGVAAFIVLLGTGVFATSLWLIKHTYEGKTKNQTNILADASEWTWRNVIAVVHVPWRWVLPSVLIAFVAASLVHVLRERKGDHVTPHERDPQLEAIARSDKETIQSRVKLIGIYYSPNFAKGYIDFALAVYNDSVFDVVLEPSIKGDDLRFSPDWEGFHYELKSLAKTPIACPSRDGCVLSFRQPLIDGEMKQFQDDYDRIVAFGELDITIKGKEELEGVQSRPLKTNQYVHTKRGMWRVGDEMEALFVLAHQKTEVAEETSISSTSATQEERIFVDTTPQYLISLFIDHTGIQAQKLAEPYIGKWISFELEISDVLTTSSGVQLASHIAIRPTRSAVIQANFESQWVNRLAVLQRGSKVRLNARIISVSIISLYLDQCELVETPLNKEAKVTESATTSQNASAAEPQPNIIMLGDPRLTFVTSDEKFVFREEFTEAASKWAIVVDFRNQLITGEEIKGISGVFSQLTFTTAKGVSYPLNRGFWLNQENPETNFERGDTRTLFLGYLNYLGDEKKPQITTVDGKYAKPKQLHFSPDDSMSVQVTLFTQTRNRLHKECEIELTPTLRVTRPLT